MATVKPLPRCPVEVTLTLIDDRWKVLILRELLSGTRRFGEIRKALGNVSTKVLTANLRSMEDNGLLTRKVYPEVPPKVEYTLTDLGYSLRPLLFAMAEWGTNYKHRVEGQIPMRTPNGEIMLIMKTEQSDLQAISTLLALSPVRTDLLTITPQTTNALFLKAVNEQDKVVGVIGGYSENDTMYITLIAVHPDYQNQGIGTKLMEEAEKESPDRHFCLTVNESHQNISSFLEHCGYEESGRQGNCLIYQKNI